MFLVVLGLGSPRCRHRPLLMSECFLLCSKVAADGGIKGGRGGVLAEGEQRKESPLLHKDLH